MHGAVEEHVHRRIMRLTFLYGGFAFVISLIREVIKDMEDMEGDARYGCKTMPIVWGIPVAKVFTGVWLMVLTGSCLPYSSMLCISAGGGAFYTVPSSSLYHCCGLPGNCMSQQYRPILAISAGLLSL